MDQDQPILYIPSADLTRMVHAVWINVPYSDRAHHNTIRMQLQAGLLFVARCSSERLAVWTHPLPEPILLDDVGMTMTTQVFVGKGEGDIEIVFPHTDDPEGDGWIGKQVVKQVFTFIDFIPFLQPPQQVVASFTINRSEWLESALKKYTHKIEMLIPATSTEEGILLYPFDDTSDDDANFLKVEFIVRPTEQEETELGKLYAVIMPPNLLNSIEQIPSERIKVDVEAETLSLWLSASFPTDVNGVENQGDHVVHIFAPIQLDTTPND